METDILKAARKRAKHCEVYSERTNVTRVRFEANRCHAIETRSVTGTGLRLVYKDRLGFASTTTPDRVDELVDAAVETAAFAEPPGFDLPGPAELPKPRIFSNQVALQPVETMVAAGDAVLDEVRTRLPDMKVNLTLRKVVAQNRLLNTRDFDATYDRTVASLDFEGLRIVDSA